VVSSPIHNKLLDCTDVRHTRQNETKIPKLKPCLKTHELVCWCTPVIPALRKKQEDHKVKASLSPIVRPFNKQTYRKRAKLANETNT
jgi:hypothetical protein